MCKWFVKDFLVFMCKWFVIVTIFVSIYCEVAIAEQHKIIYLLSPQRSLSVAFLRMMYGRGDFEVFHEFTNRNMNIYHEAENIKQTIFDAAKKTNVFIKEISYFTSVFKDKAFLKNKNVHFVILIRNPASVMPSLYNTYQKSSYGKSSWMGLFPILYMPLYSDFLKIKQEAINPPLIILAENLQNNPKKTVELFCQHMGIPFKESFLQWDKLDDNFDPAKEWHSLRPKELADLWDKDVMDSTGFHPPKNKYEVDEHGAPTFSEIKNVEDRKKCLEDYQINSKIYELFLQEKPYILNYN